MIYEQPVDIPDGTYAGRHSGYVVKFEHEGREIRCHTKDGVRGINIPCTFRIKNNRIIESSIVHTGPSQFPKATKEST